jgi:hypothetical protein
VAAVTLATVAWTQLSAQSLSPVPRNCEVAEDANGFTLHYEHQTYTATLHFDFDYGGGFNIGSLSRTRFGFGNILSRN